MRKFNVVRESSGSRIVEAESHAHAVLAVYRELDPHGIAFLAVLESCKATPFSPATGMMRVEIHGEEFFAVEVAP